MPSTANCGFVRNPAPSQLLVAAGTTHESMLPQQRMVAERRWRLAMQSRGHPSHVMAEVYRCLKSNSVHWKKLGPYNLKCRKSIGLTGEGAGLDQGFLEFRPEQAPGRAAQGGWAAGVLHGS